VHVATGNRDLSAELKRGLSFIRGEKSSKPAPEKSTARLRKKASP
jgi:hypothetical protein